MTASAHFADGLSRARDQALTQADRPVEIDEQAGEPAARRFHG
jgi:hypothetical protein